MALCFFRYLKVELIVIAMEVVNAKVDEYARHYTTALDNLLARVEMETLTNHTQSHMLSGHVQGKLLEMLSTMIKPAHILEIGTFTGFSALCLAKGLQPGGELHTIELREADATTAKKYFTDAAMSDKIILHVGNALEIIPTLQKTWDLVFIDADKVNYINYYELTLPAVKKGGWLLADNVLFHGEVLDENPKGKNARAIQAFNDHVSKDDRVQQNLLTIRDGLLLIQKK